MNIRPRSRARRFIALHACGAAGVIAPSRARRSAIARRFPTRSNGISPTSTRRTRRGAAAKEAFAAELPTLGRFKGQLTSSAGVAGRRARPVFALDKELSRLYVYASLLADQDTRDSQHQGMRQEMTQLAATFGAQAAYIEPEVLKAGKAAVERFLAAEPRLKVYRVYLEDIAAARGAHAHRQRREAPRRCRPAGRQGRRTSTTSSRTPTSRTRPSR